MINALIVEDEKMARESLARTVSANFPDITVVGMTASVQETLAWLRDTSNKADIIFMDVELSDGDCFEIFRQEKIDAKVILTTAYDSYAVKAFEAGSIDYLLKPISLEDLDRAISRCRERSAGIDMEALLKAISPARAPQRKERIIVHVGDNIIPVKVGDIAFFYSENKSNYLTVKDGTSYIMDLTLDSIEEELDPASFFRISRSCIIAISSIKTVSKQLGGRLKITAEPRPSCDMTVARARVDDFLKWLG